MTPRPDIVACPHCGASARRGQLGCEKCGKALWGGSLMYLAPEQLERLAGYLGLTHEQLAAQLPKLVKVMDRAGSDVLRRQRKLFDVVAAEYGISGDALYRWCVERGWWSQGSQAERGEW